MAGGGGANVDISKGLARVYRNMRSLEAGSKNSRRVYFGKMITRSPIFTQIYKRGSIFREWKHNSPSLVNLLFIKLHITTFSQNFRSTW